MAGIWTALPATVVGISATSSIGTLLKIGVGWASARESGLARRSARGRLGVGVGVADEQPAIRRRADSATTCGWGGVPPAQHHVGGPHGRRYDSARGGVVAQAAPDSTAGASLCTAVLPAPVGACGNDGGERLDDLLAYRPDPCRSALRAAARPRRFPWSR
jgi:hypothetical protein